MLQSKCPPIQAVANIEATPLVSVITPVFRGEHTLIRAVKSLLLQDYEHWEQWIVIDDGVDYPALLYAAGIDDPRIHFIDSGRVGSGPNYTRNLALQQARGDIIAPLDADDLYFPTRLSRLVPLALKHGVAGDNVDVVDDSHEQLLATVLPSFDGARTWSARAYCETKTPFIFLFRRDCIKQEWQEDVQLGEDTLFNLRAMEQAGGCVIWGQSLHQYRVNSTSICHSEDATARADCAYQHCLDRLTSDGMGFESAHYLCLVEEMLSVKKAVNLAYDAALQQGFVGSYQHFALARYPVAAEFCPVSPEPQAVIRSAIEESQVE